MSSPLNGLFPSPVTLLAAIRGQEEEARLGRPVDPHDIVRRNADAGKRFGSKAVESSSIAADKLGARRLRGSRDRSPSAALTLTRGRMTSPCQPTARAIDRDDQLAVEHQTQRPLPVAAGPPRKAPTPCSATQRQLDRARDTSHGSDNRRGTASGRIKLIGDAVEDQRGPRRDRHAVQQLERLLHLERRHHRGDCRRSRHLAREICVPRQRSGQL